MNSETPSQPPSLDEPIEAIIVEIDDDEAATPPPSPVGGSTQ